MTDVASGGRYPLPMVGQPARSATVEDLRALSHPLRWRILRLCLDQALTNQQIAQHLNLSPATTLPSDGVAGTLIGRVWLPDVDGPSVVVAKGDALHDITRTFPTVRDLSERLR